ncbi:MAG: Rieske (2Fe-2S) protein [Deferribacterota bacterium]|nr:Rieske (2Fe-2S) protein [Deferribacterota bacterium]
MEKSRKIYRISKRNILKLILAIFGFIFLYKYLIPSGLKKSNTIKIELDRIPKEGGLIIKNKRVAVINKDNKIYALSIVCTHLGCTLNLTETNFICPCHGSKFSLTGKALKGPANRDLKNLPFKIIKNTLFIYC